MSESTNPDKSAAHTPGIVDLLPQHVGKARAHPRMRPRGTRVPLPLRVGAFELRKAGAVRYDLRDPYHVAITMPWPHFLASVVSAQLAVNLLFATLYWLVPSAIANARPGSFLDLFFFSIETLATVGYGTMSPTTLYGHIISATEIFTGTIFTAIVTGLVFFRFSKPRAKIVFSDMAVIAPRDGTPTLMIRLGNGRMSLLTGATARLHALVLEESVEGERHRLWRQLPLVRDYNPLFALTWTVQHRLDEDSPLFGATPDSLRQSNIRLILAIEGFDESLATTVRSIKDYGVDEILFNTRFADAVLFDADGNTYADLDRISLVLPIEVGLDFSDAGAAD